MAYDYRRAVLADLEEMIRESKEEILEEVGADSLEEADREKLAETIKEMALVDDHVTGNGSSMYTSSYNAEEMLVGNDNVIAETLNEFCIETKLGYNQGKAITGDFIDTSVRCYMLDVVMDEAIDNVLESPDKQVAKAEGLEIDREYYEHYSYHDEVRKEIESYVNDNLEEIVDKLSEDGFTADEVEDGLDTILFEKIVEGELDLPSVSDIEIMHNLEEAFTNDTLTGSDYKVVNYFEDLEAERTVKDCYAEMVAVEEKSNVIETVSDKVKELLEQKEENKTDVDLD